MKPNFLIIGAMKSGTTSFHNILSKHPDVFMSKPKEPEFFCRDHIYRRGWKWYESLFANAQGKIAIGEASTSYTKKGDNYSPDTVARISKHLPNAKLIYIVRNPLERIESHWRQGRYLGWCSKDFNEAIKESRVINPSRYWWQISAYRDFFPDKQIKVLFFEDFKKEPHKTLQICLDFLGVNSLVTLPDIQHPKNVSMNWEKPQWDYEIKQKVIEQIYNDSQKFLSFYGKPTNFWDFEDYSFEIPKIHKTFKKEKVSNMEQEKFPDKMMVFLHIPKTAGTSLRLALEKQVKIAWDYGCNEKETSDFIKETFYQGKYDDFLKIIKNENYQCIVGHFEANKYSMFFNSSTKIITFFREPIQRCISGYFHMHRHYGYNKPVEIFANQNHNSQTRFISPLKLENIFFGIAEDYENSIKLLSKQLNLELEEIKINVNPQKRVQKKYRCDPGLLKLFEINSLEDIKLYQKAQEIFEERLVKEGIKISTSKSSSHSFDDDEKYHKNQELMLTTFQSRFRCAQLLQAKKQFLEATLLYQKALELDPNSHNALHNLGQCLAQQRKFTKAIQCYEKAIEIEPKCYEYYHSFGDARFEQKCWQKAIVLYQKAITLNPDFAWSHYNQGRAYANQGLIKEAIDAYNKALRVNPKFTQCRQSLTEILALHNKEINQEMMKN